MISDTKTPTDGQDMSESLLVRSLEWARWAHSEKGDGTGSPEDLKVKALRDALASLTEEQIADWCWEFEAVERDCRNPTMTCYSKTITDSAPAIRLLLAALKSEGERQSG